MDESDEQEREDYLEELTEEKEQAETARQEQKLEEDLRTEEEKVLEAKLAEECPIRPPTRIYQMDPPPPDGSAQEFILKYLETGESRYMAWFLHKAETLINRKAWGMIETYAMYGHFAEMKQACVEGIWLATKQYRPEAGTSFWWYAAKYAIPGAVHRYIRQARPGFSVESDSEYKTLRNIMARDRKFRDEKQEDPLAKTAEEMGLSEKTVKDYLLSGLQNRGMRSLEESVRSRLPIPDYGTDPARSALCSERQDVLFAEFLKLSYREQEIVAGRLGFCPRCLNTKNADGSDRQRMFFEDLAIPYGLTPKAAAELYERAIAKLRKAMQPWKEPGEEDERKNGLMW